MKASFDEMLIDYGLTDKVEVVAVNCLKQCLTGISILVMPDQVYYGAVKTSDLPQLIEEHLIQGQPVKELMVKAHKISFLDLNRF